MLVPLFVLLYHLVMLFLYQHPWHVDSSSSTPVVQGPSPLVDTTLNLSAKPGLNDILNDVQMLGGFNHMMSDFSQFETLLDSLPDPNTICPIPDYYLHPSLLDALINTVQYEFGSSNVEWSATRTIPPHAAAFGLYSAQLNVGKCCL